MERKHIPETENRLMILYALRLMGSATGMQLLEFLAENDLMNYFTFQLSLSDLKEQGQVATSCHPAGELLHLTQEGSYTIEAFAQRIPLSRRNLMEQQAPHWRERFRTEQLTPAEATPLLEGGTCLHLRLLEGGATLLDISLVLPALPTFLEKRWRTAAQTVYAGVMLRLSQGETAAPAPGTATIRQTGAAEWLLTLVDDETHPTLTLLLPMADEALAHHCAAAWPGQCASLRRLIVHTLEASLKQ